MRTLLEQLIAYGNSDIYPFHMPGHKRQCDHQLLAQFPNPFSIDITEVEGFDNLHHPEGILKDSLEWAADVYGSDKTYYLVNGSSSGILSAISGTVKRGGTILLGRNCHKSAYHAVLLRDLHAIYLHPEVIPEFGIQGGITPADVDEALQKNPEIQAVMITSPTYDGIVSDVGAIAEIAHRFNVPLIVDEAHGAHFPFAEEGSVFPTSAIALGADVVIQSIHKTLPSLTQTAVMHLKKGFITVENVDRYTHIYQSTSPSYVLLASIEQCIAYMNEGGRGDLMRFGERIEAIRNQLTDLQQLRFINTSFKGKYGVYDIDPSKVIVSTKYADISGVELERILREVCSLEMEMYTANYVTAMTSLLDTDEGLQRLVQAFTAIDARLAAHKKQSDAIEPHAIPHTEQIQTTIAVAVEAPQVQRRLADVAGQVSAEFIYVYPPGTPIVAPGEVFTEEVIARIQEYKRLGLPVQGPHDPRCESIFVLE